MGSRKMSLVNDHYYHIFSRSIAGFNIFNDESDFERFKQLMRLCRFKDFTFKYSRFLKFDEIVKESIYDQLVKSDEVFTRIVAHSIMPTHIHLILKQVSDNGISRFVADILNGYTKYFNARHHRKGPLWEGHFNNVIVETDKQMLHLTRYLHLNSTTAGITEKPEDWPHSSYLDYLGLNKEKSFCDFDFLEIDPVKYKKFVNDQISYQKKLGRIKSILIDHYTG